MQVEIQATVEVYRVPLYLFTQTPTRNSYHWLCINSTRTQASTIPQTHLKLTHPLSVHIDAITDTTTNKPRLTDKTDLYPFVL